MFGSSFLIYLLSLLKCHWNNSRGKLKKDLNASIRIKKQKTRLSNHVLENERQSPRGNWQQVQESQRHGGKLGSSPRTSSQGSGTGPPAALGRRVQSLLEKQLDSWEFSPPAPSPFLSSFLTLLPPWSRPSPWLKESVLTSNWCIFPALTPPQMLTSGLLPDISRHLLLAPGLRGEQDDSPPLAEPQLLVDVHRVLLKANLQVPKVRLANPWLPGGRWVLDWPGTAVKDSPPRPPWLKAIHFLVSSVWTALHSFDMLYLHYSVQNIF